MSVFVDSSAFVALLAEDDQNHQPAWQAWRDLLSDNTPIRTGNYVVAETVAVLQRRIGVRAVRELVDGLLAAVGVVWVRPEEHHRALRALITLDRRTLSLVDCVSFEVMRETGIGQAFAFDPHFSEQGFECLPTRQE